MIDNEPSDPETDPSLMSAAIFAPTFKPAPIRWEARSPAGHASNTLAETVAATSGRNWWWRPVGIEIVRTPHGLAAG